MTADQYFVTRWNSGALIRPQAALAALRRDPESFLKKYPIQNTIDVPASGQTTIYIFNEMNPANRPGNILGTQGMHPTPAFSLKRHQGQLREGFQASAHAVHMVDANQHNNYDAWYTLDAQGPDLMVTARLTGCTFVARRAPGATSLQVTHIRPTQQVDGLALNRQQNQPGQVAWGRFKYDLDSRAVNVIGVRSGGRWKIFAQKLEKVRLNIRSVHQII